jgi:hypothetical protein
MRIVILPDGGSYPYAEAAYANPDAVTQIANGLSTTTFTYDNDQTPRQHQLLFHPVAESSAAHRNLVPEELGLEDCLKVF